MCRVLGVARSGFYAWERRAPSARALADAFLTEQVKRIWEASGKTYGARRCHAKLHLESVRIAQARRAADGSRRDLGLAAAQATPDHDPR